MTEKQPGPSHRRRWLSFSLRTLFLFVTIGCVWLAVVSTRARRQAAAIAKIEGLNAPLRFAYQGDDLGNAVKDDRPIAPLWLRRALGEDYFRRVVTVDFNYGGGDKATDDDLAVFRTLRDVTTLELNNNPRVTDAGLVHLAGLSKLRVMYLYRSSVKGPGIRHLPRNIEFLNLDRTPMEDQGLVSMQYLKQLKVLRLRFTNITDDGLAHLSGHPALEELGLSHTDVTDAGLDHLKSVKNLKGLSLDHTKVTSAGIARLQQALPNCLIHPKPEWLDALPQDVDLWPDDYQPSTAEILAKIQEFDGDADVEVDKTRLAEPIISFTLFNSNVSDETLIRLLAAMPELEQLNLRGVLVGDRLAKALPRFSKLSWLSLDESRITDDGLQDVARIPTLKYITLTNVGASDAGFMYLARLNNLEHLLVHECDLSDETYNKLRKALPECSISR